MSRNIIESVARQIRIAGYKWYLQVAFNIVILGVLFKCYSF